MSFLTRRDYRMSIQDADLTMLLKQDLVQLEDCEAQAVDEAKSYMRQRWDTDAIFQDTITYDPTLTFTARQLTYMWAPSWIAQSYTAGQIVSWTSVAVPNLYTKIGIYICIVNAASTNLPSDGTYWLQIGNLHDYYYLDYPYWPFKSDEPYVSGDIKFYKDYIYSCNTQSTPLSHQDEIQYNYTSEYPTPNIRPCPQGNSQWSIGTQYGIEGIKPNDTATAWSNATTYSIGQTAAYVINNISVMFQSLTNSNINNIPGADIINWVPVKWKLGDSRNKQLVKAIVDISLYNLHAGFASMNVPVIRERNYATAIKWLEDIQKQVFSFSEFQLPKKQPPRGARILMGGRPKTENNY